MQDQANRKGLSSVALFGLACALLVGASSAQEEQRRTIPHSVGVSGKATNAGLVLLVRFDPGEAASPFDAFRLYSLPSETLLLAHYDPLRDLEQKPGLITVQGTMNAFQHSVVVPTGSLYETDNKISVRLLFRGVEQTVSQGSVDFQDFDITSRFDPELVLNQRKRAGSTTEIGGCGAGEWEHCSGGPRCVMGCICCDSAYFCANLITCNMECGDVEDC